MNPHLVRVVRDVLLAALLMTGTPAAAVQPDEVLSDPALEARARTLSADLRCMVCQNQSIDDSDAPLARDLRILLRERLVAGDTDEEVIDFLVVRYGEFVLLKPTVAPHTILLWSAPIVALVIGGAIAVLAYRRRAASPVTPEPLDEREHERLKRLLSDNS